MCSLAVLVVQSLLDDLMSVIVVEVSGSCVAFVLLVAPVAVQILPWLVDHSMFEAVVLLVVWLHQVVALTSMLVVLVDQNPLARLILLFLD